MAKIIKQPNGLYCIFSGTVDNITDYNLTENEVIEALYQKQIQYLKETITAEVKRQLSKKSVDSYQEMLNTIEFHYGNLEKEKVSALIERG